MIKQLSITIAIAALLTGCASAPNTTATNIAWDGLGRDPNLALPKRLVHSATAKRQENPNVEREKTLATLRRYSQAWWTVHDEIEAEDNRQLYSKLAICRGCIAHEDNITGAAR